MTSVLPYMYTPLEQEAMDYCLSIPKHSDQLACVKNNYFLMRDYIYSENLYPCIGTNLDSIAPFTCEASLDVKCMLKYNERVTNQRLYS